MTRFGTGKIFGLSVCTNSFDEFRLPLENILELVLIRFNIGKTFLYFDSRIFDLIKIFGRKYSDWGGGHKFPTNIIFVWFPHMFKSTSYHIGANFPNRKRMTSDFERCLGKWSADCAECDECKLRWVLNCQIEAFLWILRWLSNFLCRLRLEVLQILLKAFFVKWRLSVDCCWVGGRIPLTGNFEWNQDGEMILYCECIHIEGKKGGGGYGIIKTCF